jgi:hypothetical protein
MFYKLQFHISDKNYGTGKKTTDNFMEIPGRTQVLKFRMEIPGRTQVLKFRV